MTVNCGPVIRKQRQRKFKCMWDALQRRAQIAIGRGVVDALNIAACVRRASQDNFSTVRDCSPIAFDCRYAESRASRGLVRRVCQGSRGSPSVCHSHTVEPSRVIKTVAGCLPCARRYLTDTPSHIFLSTSGCAAAARAKNRSGTVAQMASLMAPVRSR